MILFITSFVAGVLTILAPCILPLLPVIIGGSLGSGNKYRALIIAGSLAITVIVFTYVLKVSTVFIGIPNSFWTYFSGVIVIILGILMIWPNLWQKIPGVNKLYNSSQGLMGEGQMKKTIWGDVIIGASLGPIFSTCSPTYFLILATVLPASPGLGFLYILAYAIGLALALLCVSLVGQKILSNIAVSTKDGSTFKRVLGSLLIVVGLLITSGYIKKIETYLVEQGYGVTSIEKDLINAITKKSDSSLLPGVFPKYKEFVDPAGYVNTDNKPIKIADYLGKNIILLDIMTYSCINCQRTFPYLKKWDEKYRDKGLVTIGIHTPEFAFEKKKENVEAAMKEFGLSFPIILDNEYKTWNAYENSYWPRKYIIDLDGNIVYDHIGEGEYDETEAKIQELLVARNTRLGLDINVNIPIEKITKKTSPSEITPETYLGTDRSEYEVIFSNNIPQNRYALMGAWIKEHEYIKSSKIGDRLDFNIISPSVYIVTGENAPIETDIYVDNVFYKTFNLGGAKLFKIYENDGTKPHVISMRPKKSGLILHAFTFGE